MVASDSADDDKSRELKKNVVIQLEDAGGNHVQELPEGTWMMRCKINSEGSGGSGGGGAQSLPHLEGCNGKAQVRKFIRQLRNVEGVAQIVPRW